MLSYYYVKSIKYTAITAKLELARKKGSLQKLLTDLILFPSFLDRNSIDRENRATRTNKNLRSARPLKTNESFFLDTSRPRRTSSLTGWVH